MCYDARMQAKAALENNIFPGMRYRDCRAAIAWLEKAFDFRAQLVVPGEDERDVAHAQLRAGENGGIIMLGSTRDDAFGYRSPAQAGGVTHSIYVRVDDIDGHYARSSAAGAEICHELTDTGYGSRDYSARDPEGFLWHFGTYDPGT
jgi:uncharacterized glyoxalase superfamily protein PhnB